LCFASKSTFSKKVGKANQNDLCFSHRVTHTTLEEEMSNEPIFKGYDDEGMAVFELPFDL
jgi:hypothetical protein